MDNHPKINIELARHKQLSDDTITSIETIMDKINIIHQRPLYYFESYNDTVKVVESLETTLQLLWGFQYKPDYQSYRFGFKDCTCPKMDNQDSNGTGIFYYNKNCVIHEHLFEQSEDF